MVRLADDFVPAGLAGQGESPGERCTSSPAAHSYRVSHSEEQHLYFVRLGLDGDCAGAVLDWGAEYAIDDRTWKIRGRRTASEIPPLQSPRLALLGIADCPVCSTRADWTSSFAYGITGVPRDHVFAVQNLGEQPATALGDGGGLANGFAFKDGAYPGTGGTCGATLASGERCTVVVTFTPGTEAEGSSAIALGYHDGATRRTVTRPVRGGSAPRAHLFIGDRPHDIGGDSYAPPDHDFGTAGIPLDHTFFVQNTGAQAATGLRPGDTLGENFTFEGGSYPGTGGTCTTSLASGAHCTVVVTFTPTGTGPRSGTFTLAYDNGSGRFPGFVSTCGQVAPGESCSVVVHFNPATRGVYLGELVINYGDDLGPTLQARRTLRGTAE